MGIDLEWSIGEKISEPRLSVLTSHRIVAETTILSEHAEDLVRNNRAALPIKAVPIEEDQWQFTCNLWRVGQEHDWEKRQQALYRIVKTLAQLAVEAERQAAHSPVFAAHLSAEPVDGAQLGLLVSFRWPEPKLPDEELSDLATAAMQHTAAQLQYQAGIAEEYGYDDIISAQVSHRRGISLNIGPDGGARLHNSLLFYGPEDGRITLHACNVMTHEEQLIGLSGALAVAYAHELVAKE